VNRLAYQGKPQPHRGGSPVREAAFNQRRPGALLSSDVLPARGPQQVQREIKRFPPHATALTATNSTTVRFADTNILLYASPATPRSRTRPPRANDILTARDVALSVQVLQEFYVRATRASRPDPFTHEQATRLMESFLRLAVLDITTDLTLAAATSCQRFGVSYWDAAILEAARSLGCEACALPSGRRAPPGKPASSPTRE
jgi:predicted nucleic acid-binding protein